MNHAMEHIVERIARSENFTEEKARKKLNLIYVKMNAAGVRQFVDEFIDWLMEKRQLNFKQILKTPDKELFETFEKEYKNI